MSIQMENFKQNANILYEKEKIMLNITYIYMGAQKEDFFRRAMDEYEKRISRFAKFTEKVIKPEALPENPSDGFVSTLLEKEAKNVLSAMPKNCYKIALCIEGKQMSSENLAELFEKTASMGISDICFVVGSSYGLSDTVKSACDLKLSFSKMTFAHGLFGVMLLEQVYRALTINAGEKYHK